VLVYLAGVSRSKHAASAAVRSICELVTATLCFWAVGSAILLQEQNQYLGLDYHKLFNDQMPYFPLTLAITLVGSSLAIGPMAERGRFRLVAPLAALVSILIVPVVGQWNWHLLARSGGIDIGGALPIVLCPSVVGLVAAVMVGPRANKYNRDGSANAIPGHNAILTAGGALLMLAGWLAYLAIANYVWANYGLLRTLSNAILAASAGSAAAMIFGFIRHRKADLTLALMGLVAGMASAAPGIGLMPAWAAVLLAAVSGAAGVWCATWVDVRWRVDDASNLAVAMIISSALSLLVTPLITGVSWMVRLKGIGANSLAIAAGVTVAGLCTWGLLAAMKRFTALRVGEADEYDGLDLAEHDQNAYPDFQQTMIKSYHLRET
jgi:Amt family ammonium transporter